MPSRQKYSLDTKLFDVDDDENDKEDDDDDTATLYCFVAHTMF